ETKHGKAKWHRECLRKHQIESSGKVVCEVCGKGTRPGVECNRCLRASGYVRPDGRVTKNAFAKSISCSGSHLSHAVHCGKLGGAWDGETIDPEHPDAVRFMFEVLRRRPSRGQLRGPYCIAGSEFTLKELSAATGISMSVIWHRM